MQVFCHTYFLIRYTFSYSLLLNFWAISHILVENYIFYIDLDVSYPYQIMKGIVIGIFFLDRCKLLLKLLSDNQGNDFVKIKFSRGGGTKLT